MSQAKADCEMLLNAAMPFAQQMLAEHGEFFPFGNAMRTNGEIVAVGAYDAEEHPPSGHVIRQLKEAFQHGARKQEYKATALTYDVKITLPASGEISDAIAVALDHREGGYTVTVLFPYELREGRVTIGEPFAQPGDADVFLPASPHSQPSD